MNDKISILEKGFTSSNKNKSYSTGIGLYLAKKISDCLGLRIDIESKEKLYTKVSIVFPKTELYDTK